MGKFDGLEIAADKPERMFLLHPTTRAPLCNKDDKADVAYIDLYSADSEIKLKHDRAITRRNLARRSRKPAEPEEIEKDVNDLFAALTAGWRLIGLDGTPIDIAFNRDDALELYSSHRMVWVREQVDQWVSDRENFLKASSTT